MEAFSERIPMTDFNQAHDFFVMNALTLFYIVLLLLQYNWWIWLSPFNHLRDLTVTLTLVSDWLDTYRFADDCSRIVFHRVAFDPHSLESFKIPNVKSYPISLPIEWKMSECFYTGWLPQSYNINMPTVKLRAVIYWWQQTSCLEKSAHLNIYVT